jgi:hypothetical protein
MDVSSGRTWLFAPIGDFGPGGPHPDPWLAFGARSRYIRKRMGVTRILDLIVIVLLATVLLMPRPDATVKQALNVDPESRERVAELQAMLVGHPDDADASAELANIFLDGHRPDWALATVDGTLAYHPDDFRLYHLRAIAFADRFEGGPAAEAAQKALALCEASPPPKGAPGCGDAAHSRIALLASTLAAVSRVDMKAAPYLAKDRIYEQLHPAFLPKPKARSGDRSPRPSPPAAVP